MRRRVPQLALVAVILVSATCREVEYNPIVKKADVVGRWHLDETIVEVAADGRFRMSVGRTGTWDLRDWNLTLSFDDGKVEFWRVVTVNDRVTLIRNWGGMDRSGWSDLYFSRMK